MNKMGNHNSNEIQFPSLWEVTRIILGVLNMAAGAYMMWNYVYCINITRPSERLEGALTWYLPFIVASVFALTGGILTFLGKHKFWAFIGLVLTGAAIAYWQILTWLFSLYA